jgi:hypothetical protein
MFKVVNINHCLSLRDENFVDTSYNIDYLSAKLFEKLDIEEKLSIATSAINLCEKFHSYFHFEESYLHLLLAKRSGCNSELYVSELEAAIFQDPLNYEARNLLEEILPGGDVRLSDHRYSGGRRLEEYCRYLPSYSHFLKFACSCDVVLTQPQTDSYWHKLELYESCGEVELLQSAVERITASHKLYHSEAAKLYYNRYVLFNIKSCTILAKNDLVKAKNLDKTLLLDNLQLKNVY